MQQNLMDLDVSTLHSIFIKASKEFSEATKKSICVDELSAMYEHIKEIYDIMRLKRFYENPVLGW